MARGALGNPLVVFPWSGRAPARPGRPRLGRAKLAGPGQAGAWLSRAGPRRPPAGTGRRGRLGAGRATITSKAPRTFHWVLLLVPRSMAMDFFVRPSSTCKLFGDRHMNHMNATETGRVASPRNFRTPGHAWHPRNSRNSGPGSTGW